MKIKRYNTINSIGQEMKIEENELKLQEVNAEYQVDDSQFAPIAETLKTLKGGAITETERQLYYDTKNVHSQGKDIAELSQEINNKSKALGKEVKKIIKEKQQEEEFQRKLDEIKK